MLNWAARYYPILRVLRQHDLLSEGNILEIGSGPVGLGTFRKVPFVGCDLSFPGPPPKWPMIPVVASATDLPFDDNAFDAVVASDVLEHIPPESRTRVISEALRVARQVVIFGFPCGSAAYEADTALRQHYLRKHTEVPIWLEEHMLAPFPEPDLFDNVPDWDVTHFGNESVAFHSWMMRREMNRVFVRASGAFRKFLPKMLEKLLSCADSPPYYRQIFVLTKPPRQISEQKAVQVS